MESHFIEAVFAVQPVILGRKLKPFCCGHAVILDALKSAYFTAGDITQDEIVVAVWVCSRSYEQGKDELLNGGERIKDECREWGAENMLFDFLECHRAFNTYLEAHLKAPERWKKSSGTSGTKAPWPLVVATSLMTELRMSETQAWNLPLQEALWYFAALSESRGDRSLITDEERERIKMARENVAQVNEEDLNG